MTRIAVEPPFLSVEFGHGLPSEDRNLMATSVGVDRIGIRTFRYYWSAGRSLEESMAASTKGSRDAAILFERLVEGDETGCRKFVSRLREKEGVSVLSLCEAMTEAFYQVGDAWECSEISIYREHIASQIGFRVLQDVRSSLTTPVADAPVAIGCTPDKDPYTLPTCMVELVLRESGWQALSLGTNLPLRELTLAMDFYKPQLCWVSASYTETPNTLREQLLDLGAAGRSRGVEVICGGRAVPDDVRTCSRIEFIDRLRDLQRRI